MFNEFVLLHSGTWSGVKSFNFLSQYCTTDLDTNETNCPFLENVWSKCLGKNSPCILNISYQMFGKLILYMYLHDLIDKWQLTFQNESWKIQSCLFDKTWNSGPAKIKIEQFWIFKRELRLAHAHQCSITFGQNWSDFVNFEED